jgi:hypothetical protein
MPVLSSCGINTYSVFFQGSRFGDVAGYNEDTTLNVTYASRMSQIIEAADAYGAVVLVGCLYYGDSDGWWPSWGQAEANQAVANTVQWLADHQYYNVFIDVDNEHMSPFDDAQLIAAGKAVNPNYVMGASGYDFPANAGKTSDVNCCNPLALLHLTMRRYRLRLKRTMPLLGGSRRFVMLRRGYDRSG